MLPHPTQPHLTQPHPTHLHAHIFVHAKPPWRQPRGKWMISLVNSNTNINPKRWHLCEIDLRFALNSALGWGGARTQNARSGASVARSEQLRKRQLRHVLPPRQKRVTRNLVEYRFVFRAALAEGSRKTENALRLAIEKKKVGI